MAMGGFPHKEFWPTYSSFANTDGGVIIIGVKEKNGNFYSEGLSAETVEQYEKNLLGQHQRSQSSEP